MTVHIGIITGNQDLLQGKGMKIAFLFFTTMEKVSFFRRKVLFMRCRFHVYFAASGLSVPALPF